jgi:soluble lytic murein transglycosylase-like protein
MNSSASFPIYVALAAAFLCGALFGTRAHADVYTFVEQDGTVRLSNVPDDPRYKLFLREPNDYKLKGRKTSVKLRNSDQYRLNGSNDAPPDIQALLDKQPYRADVLAAAKLNHLDPALVHAVIAVESNYNPAALSPKGAVGLMQVLPATALRYGVNAKELMRPALNIRAGAHYLADLLAMFGGDLSLALAGYNAGEGAVQRYGNRIPPYAETQAYVPRVLAYYKQFGGE